MYTPNFKLSQADLTAKQEFLNNLEEQGLLENKFMLKDFKPANNYLLTIAKGYNTKTEALKQEALMAEKEKTKARHSEIVKKGIIVDSSVRKELQKDKMIKESEEAIDSRFYVLGIGSDYRGDANIGDSILVNVNEHNASDYYEVPLWDAELNTETMEWELAEYVFSLAPSHWIVGVFKNSVDSSDSSFSKDNDSE